MCPTFAGLVSTTQTSYSYIAWMTSFQSLVSSILYPLPSCITQHPKIQLRITASLRWNRQRSRTTRGWRDGGRGARRGREGDGHALLLASVVICLNCQLRREAVVPS